MTERRASHYSGDMVVSAPIVNACSRSRNGISTEHRRGFQREADREPCIREMQDPNYRLAQCAQVLHCTRRAPWAIRGDSRDGAGNMAVRPKNVADRDKHHGGDCERRQHQSRLHRPLDALLAQAAAVNAGTIRPPITVTNVNTTSIPMFRAWSAMTGFLRMSAT